LSELRGLIAAKEGISEEQIIMDRLRQRSVNCWPLRKEAARVEFSLERDAISIVRGQLALNSSADVSGGVTTCRF
jgi:hypothetical protein